MNMNDFQLLRICCGPLLRRQRNDLLRMVFWRWRQSRYQQLFLDIDGAVMRFQLEVWLVCESRSLESLNDILQEHGYAGVDIPLFTEMYGELP